MEEEGLWTKSNPRALSSNPANVVNAMNVEVEQVAPTPQPVQPVIATPVQSQPIAQPVQQQPVTKAPTSAAEQKRAKELVDWSGQKQQEIELLQVQIQLKARKEAEARGEKYVSPPLSPRGEKGDSPQSPKKPLSPRQDPAKIENKQVFAQKPVVVQQQSKPSQQSPQAQPRAQPNPNPYQQPVQSSPSAFTSTAQSLPTMDFSGGNSIFVTNPSSQRPSQQPAQTSNAFLVNKSDALNARVRDMRAVDAPLFQSTWTSQELCEWASIFLDAEDVNKLRRMRFELNYC